MPVQDLTPQLRTRLSRVERAVGVFVIIATLLLLGGLAFYVYSTAQRKGWLLKKFNYHTFVDTATGIRVGQPVKMMGFDAGTITHIVPMDPYFAYGNVYIQFEVREPYQGYIWDDSRAKVIALGFLGERGIEVSKGGGSGRTNLHPTYKLEDKTEKVLGVWDDKKGDYVDVTTKPKGYTLEKDESPAITERAEKLVGQLEAYLPKLTNQISGILSNVTTLTARAELLLVDAQPILTNAAVITANLKDPDGSLGKWILTPELNSQITHTLTNLNATLTNASAMTVQAKETIFNTDSNLTKTISGLDDTIINLANLTSNLNQQVQMNTNLVSNINSAIVSADTMMQGLKKHWLLRSAFKEKKPKEPKQVTPVKRK